MAYDKLRQELKMAAVEVSGVKKTITSKDAELTEKDKEIEDLKAQLESMRDGRGLIWS